MATFNSPSTDASTITNASLSGASRTWDDATETWNENTNTWDNPYLSEANPDAHPSTIVNTAKN